MSYSDILNTTQLYGDLLRKNFSNTANNLSNVRYNAGPVNPNSSAAFVPKTARDIYGYSTEVNNPLSEYSDYKPYGGIENILLQGTQGLNYGKMGTTMSPYLKGGIDAFGQNIKLTDGSTKWLPAGQEMPDGATAMGGSLDLGPAATVYGLTQNQNPYDYTQTEALGSTASNVMAAHALGSYVAPAAYSAGAIGGAGATGLAAVNPYVALAAIAYSWWRNKKKKKKAKKLKETAIGDFQDKLDEGYTSREDNLKEMRDEMLSQQTSRAYTERLGQYDNQYGGAYAEEGMKFSPKELKKIASAGRNGDTTLAHINPQEAQMLKQMGGSGSINPYTGLPEYWNPFNSIFNAAFGIIDPVADVAHDTVSAGGDVVSNTVNTGVGIATNATQSAGNLASGFLGSTSNIINPVLNPMFDAVGNIVDPALEGASNAWQGIGDDLLAPAIEGMASGATGFVHGLGDYAMTMGEEIVSLPGDVLSTLGTLFDGSSDGGTYGTQGTVTETKGDINKDVLSRDKKTSGLRMTGSDALSKIQQSRDKEKLTQGDWVGDKPNPFTTPNVEEELDYANKGMKYKYAQGGSANIVAEFTGNELIVNNQDDLERALKNKDYKTAASYIRDGMNKGNITPGPETHQGNPMPVDAEGNIYAGGGTLPIKVAKGAGIYDHATDQFKRSMSDKEISMVAQENINKWKSNNMYS